MQLGMGEEVFLGVLVVGVEGDGGTEAFGRVSASVGLGEEYDGGGWFPVPLLVVAFDSDSLPGAGVGAGDDRVLAGHQRGAEGVDGAHGVDCGCVR